MSATVSLTHLKRIGFSEWPNRQRWESRRVMIWSQEHRAWWRPEGNGYTDDEAQAWVIDFSTAYARTEHCGPEKKISFWAVPAKVAT